MCYIVLLQFLRERKMEPFTMVLIAGWLLLMGTFATMYVLDQKVKQAKGKGAQK